MLLLCFGSASFHAIQGFWLQQHADGQFVTDGGMIGSPLRATGDWCREKHKVTTAQLGHGRFLRAVNLAAAATTW